MAKTKKDADRRAVVEQMRREQKRKERRKSLIILGAAVTVGALIIGYAAWAAVGFAALSLLHTLATLATPDALLVGLDQPLAAAGALVAVAGALLAIGRAPLPIKDVRRYLEAGAAVTVLYLASVEVVTLAGPEHTGQTLLSVLWALAGVGALVRGLLIDDRALRQGALILLGITIGKVFLYDMASLDSLYRVGSLIGLGLLLLSGAFAWQQVRGTYSSTVD